MATAAHTTIKAPPRRRPHPVAKSAVAVDRRSQPVTPPAELPGPAVLLTLIQGMWAQHRRLDDEVGHLRRAELLNKAEQRAIAADRILRRIHKLEALAIVSAPVTPTDAVAQLVLIHADVSGRCDSHEDPDVKAVPALMEGAVYALVVLAKSAGFDIASIGGTYFRPAEVMIARGEVVA